MQTIRIGQREIGPGHPVFIVAELSANHGGKLSIAKETVAAAAEAGADAIKLQTYTPDTITLDCNAEAFKIRQGTLWDGRTLHDLYREAYTPWEWQPELKRHAESLGLLCFSSPFDKTAVDFLEQMNVPAYKVASFEITDIPLLEYVAAKGKPVIISTGIATEPDVVEAVSACRKQGNDQIVLLKCTSAYPAPLEDANLLTIPDLSSRFGVISGFSDHTLGTTAPIAATALGAKVIEKHFILDRSIGGPDTAFSLDQGQFRQMVDAVRDAEKVLGAVSYELSDKSKRSREFSRSLFVAEDVRAGDVVTERNVRSVRPGFGMHPRRWPEIVGKRFATAVSRGTPLADEHIAK